MGGRVTCFVLGEIVRILSKEREMVFNDASR